jgi:hypothetical protein
MSRALALSSGIGMGGTASLSGDPNLPFKVTAVVPHTIGASAGTGAWADLSTVQTAILRLTPDVPRADHVWLGTTDAAGAADRIAAGAPTAVVTNSPLVTFGQLALPVSVGTLAAAAGTLLFALLAIATVVTTLIRARHSEIAVLRALGASARTQRVASRIELLAVLGYAATIGAIAALVSVILTVPSIAHGIASGVAPDVGARVAVNPYILGSALALLALGVVIGLVVQERIIARAATRPGAELQR